MLVSTSVFEGMPNVFLQAWARGVPIVSSVDVGVPMNRLYSELDEAVRHIEKLFDDEREWADASAQALAYFRATHSPERVLRQYRELIEKVAA